LTKAQLEALQKKSKETGAPVAELIRRAIDTHIRYWNSGGTK
jgi:hypothetical protein